MLHAIKRLSIILSIVAVAAGVMVPAGKAEAGAAVFQNYQGWAHHLSNASLENEPLIIIFTELPSGKLQGNIGGNVPLNKVKLTAKGVLTFSGKLESPAGNVTVEGSGQLSATGRFLNGSLSFKGTGGYASQSGRYTFQVDSAP
jgi:hypothetical protein